MLVNLLALLVSISLSAQAKAASLCTAWAAAEPAGHLNSRLIDESSGMVISKDYPVLYHVNDSGSSARFFVSAKDGTGTIAVDIAGKTPRDTEAMGFGPCPSIQGTCLAIGDIGDNKRKRSNIEIVFIEEKQKFPAKVTPVARILAQYSDGPHNAEAMDILPNGDLVIFTKEEPTLGVSKPSILFRARKAELEAAVASKKVLTLKKIAVLDLPKMMANESFGGLATGLTVSRDGTRFVILTYQHAVEFKVDLAQEQLNFTDLKAGVDYNLIKLSPLTQQESLTYDSDDRSIIYSTEAMQRIFPRDTSAPIMRVQCQK